MHIFCCWWYKWHFIIISEWRIRRSRDKFVTLNGNRLLGVSGDVLWDTGLGGVSATVGPRIGVFMLAMDGWH